MAQGKRPASTEPEYDRDAPAKETDNAHDHKKAGVKTFDAPENKNSNSRIVLIGGAVVAIIAIIWLITMLTRSA